jgi:hypothetical protein
MTSENIKSAGKPGGIARPVVLCPLLITATLAVY